ncbi:FxLYD domain-containing protein [Kitasatospora indigofera]|uniref:FxLYD domain-containing protein n=1 Tax=Kitasatospora indigofera TaxID=67307 RepID=UPI00367FBE79
MRRIILVTIAAAAILGLTSCDPADTTTARSTNAAVPAVTGSAPAAAPAPAGDGDKLKDVEITNCTVDATLHWPSAELKITNHSGKASNYMIQVEFLDQSGMRVAEGLAVTNGLAPGQASIQNAQGTAQAKDKVSCKVVDVTRYASP